MRYLCCWLLLLLCLAPLCAESIAWPGWEVYTLGNDGDSDSYSFAYPITNMFDGNPRTACVRDGLHISSTGEEKYDHGIGTYFRIENTGKVPIICDGIGIINGYAKNQEIYQRNNRITQITIDCLCPDKKNPKGPNVDWKKTYALQETMEVQRLPLPHLHLWAIEITIDAVLSGKDDDLCISELVLYRGNTPISWGLTPTVRLSSYTDFTLSKLIHGDQFVKLDGHSGTDFLVCPHPKAPWILLLTEIGSNVFYLYDLRRDVCLWRQPFSGDGEGIGWQNNTKVILKTANKQNRVEWHCLDTVKHTWQRCAMPPKATREGLENLVDGW